MKKVSSLSTSVRRYFIDKFFLSKVILIKSGHRIIDIGGKKINKRGQFNIDSYSSKVTYVNLDPKTKPDIVANAESIPVPNGSYDIAIMAEILEHVPNPILLLQEAHRILKSNGRLICTVPFMIPIHADPYDFGRYTDTFWRKSAKEIGFTSIEITNQGTMYAVLAYMIQDLFNSGGIPTKNIFVRVIRRISEMPILHFLLWLDKKTRSRSIRAWTTGYGMVLEKSNV